MRQTENEIQAAFFSWLALHEKKHPELGLFYAIPNGSYRKFTARMIAQATGLKSGVPDVHLPLTRGNYLMGDEWEVCSGLWIEFKSDKGKLSLTQNEWIQKLEHENHFVAVCRSWTEAANITIDYLNLPIKKFGV